MQYFFLHRIMNVFLCDALLSGSVDLSVDSALRYLFGSKSVSYLMPQIRNDADALTHFKTPVYMQRLPKKALI